mmetsp:Transcript_9247/g.24247  ORF Transcript_9247/g.24247 Transcript_9247/m.24247 type:complete len:221 (-) Transcript_9247:214-876(-)
MSSQLFSSDSSASARPRSTSSSRMHSTLRGKLDPNSSRCVLIFGCMPSSLLSSSVRSCLKCTSTVAGVVPVCLHRYQTVTRSLYGQSCVSMSSIALTMLRFIDPAEPARKSLSWLAQSRWSPSYAPTWHFVSMGSSCSLTFFHKSSRNPVWSSRLFIKRLHTACSRAGSKTRPKAFVDAASLSVRHRRTRLSVPRSSMTTSSHVLSRCNITHDSGSLLMF